MFVTQTNQLLAAFAEASDSKLQELEHRISRLSARVSTVEKQVYLLDGTARRAEDLDGLRPQRI